mmetsp:Transcript_7849/g.20612  ORF Transcript_7849/g.20612 Transcript_7849/m.20612 type:complete len:303 (+) Transcript_7849:931-1839(+)
MDSRCCLRSATSSSLTILSARSRSSLSHSVKLMPSGISSPASSLTTSSLRAIARWSAPRKGSAAATPRTVSRSVRSTAGPCALAAETNMLWWSCSSAPASSSASARTVSSSRRRKRRQSASTNSGASAKSLWRKFFSLARSLFSDSARSYASRALSTRAAKLACACAVSPRRPCSRSSSASMATSRSAAWRACTCDCASLTAISSCSYTACSKSSRSSARAASLALKALHTSAVSVRSLSSSECSPRRSFSFSSSAFLRRTSNSRTCEQTARGTRHTLKKGCKASACNARGRSKWPGGGPPA